MEITIILMKIKITMIALVNLDNENADGNDEVTAKLFRIAKYRYQMASQFKRTSRPLS
jgi:hypothetical protein